MVEIGFQLPHLKRLVALFLLCVAPIMAAPKDISGKVVAVHDGDTLTVLTADKVELRIRLDGIDAPELKQAFGNKSKQSLSALAKAQADAMSAKRGLWKDAAPVAPWDFRKPKARK